VSRYSVSRSLWVKDILVFRLDALRDEQEKHAQLRRLWDKWKL
jgi:hypothetical protein